MFFSLDYQPLYLFPIKGYNCVGGGRLDVVEFSRYQTFVIYFIYRTCPESCTCFDVVCFVESSYKSIWFRLVSLVLMQLPGCPIVAPPSRIWVPNLLIQREKRIIIMPKEEKYRNKYHDDVIKWKHFPRYCPFVRWSPRSPVNTPHKGQWRGSLMLSLICVWINGWVNNREAGDLRRYRAHYDVTVMCISRVHVLLVVYWSPVDNSKSIF